MDTPEAAWERFKEPIQRAIEAIVPDAQLNEWEHAGRRRIGTFPKGIPFGTGKRFTFVLELGHVEADGRHRMTTKSYTYTILERNRTRIMAWHWHPESKQSRVETPHYHPPSTSPFSKKHIPTGRVILEDILLFGLTQLKVRAEPDAAEIIQSCRDLQVQHRTWSGSGPLVARPS